MVLQEITFDRAERSVQLGYAPDDIQRGAGLKAAVEALPAPGVLQDIQAAVDFAAGAGKVGVVGYCWGGLLAWRSAERVTGLSAAVSYYGGGMSAGSEPSRRPPEVEVHLYDAHHGFDCDQRAAHDAPAAATALARTLSHFDGHQA